MVSFRQRVIRAQHFLAGSWWGRSLQDLFCAIVVFSSCRTQRGNRTGTVGREQPADADVIRNDLAMQTFISSEPSTTLSPSELYQVVVYWID
jgi:hypothetical protein